MKKTSERCRGLSPRKAPVWPSRERVRSVRMVFPAGTMVLCPEASRRISLNVVQTPSSPKYIKVSGSCQARALTCPW